MMLNWCWAPLWRSFFFIRFGSSAGKTNGRHPAPLVQLNRRVRKPGDFSPRLAPCLRRIRNGCFLRPSLHTPRIRRRNSRRHLSRSLPPGGGLQVYRQIWPFQQLTMVAARPLKLGPKRTRFLPRLRAGLFFMPPARASREWSPRRSPNQGRSGPALCIQ